VSLVWQPLRNGGYLPRFSGRDHSLATVTTP
jgi:hypothetical protein